MVFMESEERIWFQFSRKKVTCIFDNKFCQRHAGRQYPTNLSDLLEGRGKCRKHLVRHVMYRHGFYDVLHELETLKINSP